jgi:PAT family beta-lactamase induction signal transducer AmpG
MLYLVISADNLAGGLAGAAFVAFLSSLTNVRFTAVQYAVFSSLMTLVPKVFSGYSGAMVDQLGYPVFFTVTAVMGIPVLILILICGVKLQVKDRR